MNSRPSSDNPRVSVTVTCSACGVETTVPFQPTSGRPVYCRACFAKRPPPSPRSGGPASGPAPGGYAGARPGGSWRDRQRDPASTVRKRMLSQGRKAHFVYDAREILSRGEMLEENRRVFIEMLFIRGARQSTQAAYDYLEEKVVDKTITDAEAVKLGGLVDKYSFYR